MRRDEISAAEERLLRAVEKYKGRLADAERMLRVEMDIYNAQMKRIAQQNACSPMGVPPPGE
ncbi:MAG: hypothetical protein ACM3Q1_12835 [Bacteroidales bacterium]